MNRRSFLFASTAAAALADAQTAPSAVPSRRVYSLNRNWLFGGKMSAGADAPGFDDAKFRRVTLPHTNVDLPWHSFDDKAYEFVSIYRRHFRAPAAWRGKRVFVDFGGAMTAAKVTINGHHYDEYRGGYTPFSFELTPHLKYGARQPAGGGGGLHGAGRYSALRRQHRLSDVRRHLSRRGTAGGAADAPGERVRQAGARAARARRWWWPLLSGRARIDKPVTITAELRDGDRVVKSASITVSAPAEYHDVTLEELGDIQLWSLGRPKLYQVTARLDNGDRLATRDRVPRGALHGQGILPERRSTSNCAVSTATRLIRIPAAPCRRACRRRDARVLRKELKCNIVRTSHYPQSPAFLDACDELGLLVLEEIPGWQHIGDQAWQDLAVDNTARMIRRDWNHPSIVLWGVRINESPDNHAFYTRTNEVAHKLDDSRQTGGIRNRYDSELLEDVFTMNDFGFPLRPPNHPAVPEHGIQRPHVLHQAIRQRGPRGRARDPARARAQPTGVRDRYAGGIAWCAFDYASHRYFGSGDRICYHGVSDIFRLPKPAAGFYKSQCEPEEEVVIEPGFFYAWGDAAVATGRAWCPSAPTAITSRSTTTASCCWKWIPTASRVSHLKYPPFMAESHQPLVRCVGRSEDRRIHRRQAGGDEIAFRRGHRRCAGGEARRPGVGWRWP